MGHSSFKLTLSMNIQHKNLSFFYWTYNLDDIMMGSMSNDYYKLSIIFDKFLVKIIIYFIKIM